jgi:hypothetical protein
MAWFRKNKDWAVAVKCNSSKNFMAQIRRNTERGLEILRGRPLTMEEWGSVFPQVKKVL